MIARTLITIAMLLGTTSQLLAATATWDRNPETDVTGYLLSYGTQSGVHTTTLDAGNVVSYQFFPPPGRYFVVVQAYSANGVSAKSTEVILDVAAAVNQPPTLIQPPDQTGAENVSVSLALIGSDPDGTAVTYSATGLPPSLAVNATTGLISGTLSYSSAGTHSVTATVSDGSLSASRSFTWTVSNTNRPPTLTQPADQTSPLNTAASLALVGSDPDGTALTYSASGLPPGLTVNSATGVISGTVTTAGSFTVSATASDGSLSASRTFTWAVTVGSGSTVVNLTPVDTSININTTNYVSDTRLYTYTWPAKRVANAILMKFDLSQIPANATIQSAILNLSLIEFDNATSDPTYSIALHQIINRDPDLSRATGSTANGTLAWTANNCCHSNIPLAQADISPARAVIAVDRTQGFKTWDATPIIQAWRTSPATNYGLLLNSDGTKPKDRYRFFASAQHGTVAQRPFLRVTYTIAGGDSTSSPVIVTVNNPPTNGAPTLNQPATASVSDSALSNSKTFTWTITNSNRPPVLVQPANQSSMINDTVSLSLSATDPDGTAVTYGASGLPPGLSVNASSGLISGTLGAQSGGFHDVTATASDGTLTATGTFTWGVNNSDIGMRADFDGDGYLDPATYRPAVGEWRIWNSGSAFALAPTIQWGTPNDFVVPADYDGDGRADIAIYRPSTGMWHVRLSSTNGQTTLDVQWGDPSDRPVPLDYDHDGRADLALVRYGGFDILLSSSNYTTSVVVR